MHILVGTYPQRRLFEGKVDPSKTIDEIIADVTSKHPEFDSEGRKLIIDRNQNFHRITTVDAICQYYNGRLGEMFRITDGSAVRYRIVVPPVPMSKEKGKAKEKRVTSNIYSSAYENILTMLQDRGCDPEHLTQFAMPREQLALHYEQGTIDNLSIPGLESDSPQLYDSRRRAAYVFFLNPADDVIISRRGAVYRGMLVDYMNNVITHHNSVTTSNMPKYTIDDLTDDALMKEFADKFEIIMIHSNPLSKSEYDPGIKPKFYQAFPVQNLSFVVNKHFDQPEFTLLDPDHDRDEIRNMYAQNGRILESDKTLASYGLRDNIRLFLI
jgi:hypothetical protein